MPNLLEIQRNSYELFLQKDVKPEDREDVGLQAVFNKVFPVKDFSGVAELRFIKYELEDPRYDVEECIQEKYIWFFIKNNIKSYNKRD